MIVMTAIKLEVGAVMETVKLVFVTVIECGDGGCKYVSRVCGDGGTKVCVCACDVNANVSVCEVM